MATAPKPQSGNDTLLNFAWEADWYEQRIHFRFLQDIDLMHSCTETNTYVLSPGEIDVDLSFDLVDINDTPLPFGQIVFLVYDGRGEFDLWAGTERFRPAIVEQGFRNFGYTDPKLVSDTLSVSKKDTFLLKLKY